ncbi:hypothetical protein BC830DRAFT_1100565 [Chytriomyces sp. MP71]|nr:hypothetical protein BC830DRAFT_1100565 [Chytriomyces sp. MP71]
MLPVLLHRETLYLRVLTEVLVKKSWWTKANDIQITDRWRAELRVVLRTLIDEQPQFASPNENVADNQFIDQAIDFLFQELDFIAKSRLVRVGDHGVISPAAVHGVFLSDSILPTSRVENLKSHSAPLEKLALYKKKWHEGSDGKVLDLVHPSDFPLVYGRSLQRKNLLCPSGHSVLRYDGIESGDVSKKYQWLPSEFKMGQDGKVEIASYINNLHRSVHAQLYADISAIFEDILPMFELTMGSFDTEPPVRMETAMDNATYQIDQDDYFLTEFILSRYGPDADVKDAKLRHEAQNRLDFDAFVDDMQDRGEGRPAQLPGMPEIFDPSLHAASVGKFKLNGKTLQVIVKMANIHLTPENPAFNGGSWHLEGMENECIAATGIVYYDLDNITPSRLTFRNVYDTDEGSAFQYEQSDFAGLEKAFGFSNEESNNTQISGQIEAQTGRCVVFPNFLHHRVEDFSLADASKPGHRKILAFFLVHPDHRIYSTRDVGMQQADFLARDLYTFAFGKQLPLEVVRVIAGYCRSTMSEAEAAMHAEELSKERKFTPDDGYANIQQIFLCEH